MSRYNLSIQCPLCLDWHFKYKMKDEVTELPCTCGVTMLLKEGYRLPIFSIPAKAYIQIKNTDNE